MTSIGNDIIKWVGLGWGAHSRPEHFPFTQSKFDAGAGERRERKKAGGREKEMPNVISEDVKKLWEKWNLQASILFSLFLQMVLILCAPERKRRRNIYLNYIIWSAYLLADWVAAFTVGLIASNQANMKSKTECQMPLQTEELLAFWAPFLLLHLDGPDAIIAFCWNK